MLLIPKTPPFVLKVIILRLVISFLSVEKLTHLFTGLVKIKPNNINTKALFFQLKIQKKISKTYPIIKIGKPNDNKLNQGNTFGGT